jgi:hypothetical protein
LSALDDSMDLKGYVRTPKAEGEFGGEMICPATTLHTSAQRRPRGFLHYERKQAFVMLGACPTISTSRNPPQRLEDFLDSREDAGDGGPARGWFRPATQESRAPETPWVVGYLHFGGKADKVGVGSLVRIDAASTSAGVCRVLATHDKKITVMSRDARFQGRKQIRVRDVKEHMRQRRPVYSTSGCTFAVKAWGEPPEGPGGVLILDKRLGPSWVRALSAQECWRLQELDITSATAFSHMSGGAAKCRLAGFATNGSVARAIADRALG